MLTPITCFSVFQTLLFHMERKEQYHWSNKDIRHEKNWRARYQPCQTPLSRIFWESKIFVYALYIQPTISSLLWSRLISPAFYYQFLSTLNWEHKVEFCARRAVKEIAIVNFLWGHWLYFGSTPHGGCQSQIKVQVVVPYYKCNNPDGDSYWVGDRSKGYYGP